MARDPERVNVSIYTNAKGDRRIGIQIPYILGMRIATGSTAARDKVANAIAQRVESEEAGEE